MSRSSTTTTTTTKIQVWRSPSPYLFGGLGIMLLLITVALFILFCSHCKRSSTSSSSSGEGGDGEEKPPKPTNAVLDSEPKIVVIMAGDDKPSYLATPAATTNSVCCSCGRGTDEQV